MNNYHKHDIKVEIFLVGKKWISINKWNEDKMVRRAGIATPEQNKLLDDGHQRPKRRKV